MKSRIHMVLAFGCSLGTAVGCYGQSTPAEQQKPSPQQPAPKPTGANPFPEDTSNVPVVPINGSTAAAPLPEAKENSGAATSLLKSDRDPVHSPDDPTPDASSDSGFSSSLNGANDVNIPEDEKPSKHRKLEAPEKIHQETSKEDEDVGAFELGRKNWKAALSRFQSALVSDPENPDVYWGLAEAHRGLGDLGEAKSDYHKVLEFDPDSKHGKEAKRWLREPALVNASPGNSGPPH